MPIWAGVVLAAMLFGFGAFVGYAVAAFGDLRRIERFLAVEDARLRGTWADIEVSG